MFWMNWSHGSTFMPPAATALATEVDNLYSFLLITSLIACVILIGGMIYFVLKYKRTSPTQKSAYISHNSLLEFLWSFIPLVIFLIVFAWGWKIYHDQRSAPTNSLEISVRGYQWAWEFAFKNGKKTTAEILVPINEPVKLILTATDVIHSFYVPSMRIKQDAVPGRYTSLWFQADKEGDFYVFCTEYCGAAHSNMMARIKVVKREQFDAWLQEDAEQGLSLLELGKKHYTDKGCVACHSLDGNIVVGPSFKGLFGRKGEFDTNEKYEADENYIRTSILNPNANVVKGFQKGLMPAYQGQLTESEVNALIEFIKNQKI